MSGFFARRAVAHCAAPTRLCVASPRRFLSSDNWESKWVAATDGLKVRENVCRVWYFCCAHHDGLFCDARPRPTQEARGLSQLLRSWPTKSRKRDLKWSTSSPGYRGYPVPAEQVVEQHSRMHSHFDLHDVAAKLVHARILKGSTMCSCEDVAAASVQRRFLHAPRSNNALATCAVDHFNCSASYTTLTRRTYSAHTVVFRMLLLECEFDPPPPHICAHRLTADHGCCALAADSSAFAAPQSDVTFDESANQLRKLIQTKLLKFTDLRVSGRVQLA
jgi:hypothetical protein